MFFRSKKNKENKFSKINKIGSLSKVLQNLSDDFWLLKESKIKTKMNLSKNDTKVYFGALGGMGDKIGANLYLYGTCGDWIIVDMGIGFPTMKMAGVEYVIPDTSFLEAIKGKIKAILLTHSHEDHYGAIPYIWRQVQCPVYGMSFALKMLQNKLQEYHLKDKIPLKEVNKNGEEFNLGAFKVQYINVNHSIPQACGIVLKTKQGNLFHTGDWKFDNTPVIDKPYNTSELKKLSRYGVLAVMGDSTNSIVDEHTSSETEVLAELKKIVTKIKTGKVVMTCFATNVARIDTAAKVAKASGRKLVIIGRSMETISSIAMDEGYLKDFDYISVDAAKKEEDNKLLYLSTGTQGEPRSALTRIANREYRDLKLKAGDTVIFSSKVIPGNEEAILEVQNNLSKIGVNIITTKDNSKIHSSGHAGIPELKELYNILKPQCLIPVHGEALHINRNAEIGKKCKIQNIKILQNGEFIVLENGKAPQTIEIVKTGDIVIDGIRKLSAGDEIISNRRKIHYNGTIFTSITLNKSKIVNVLVSSLGVFESDKSDTVKKAISDEIRSILSSVDKNKMKDSKYITDLVSRSIKNTFNTIMEKKPVINIHIIRI